MSCPRQEFCVRWNSHLGSIGAAFPQLLAGQRFVDVTLACEGHQLHCHRLVLAACSSYFESILAENPCKHPVIILPNDVKLWEIQALVDFMYKGEVNVTQAGLPNLLRCAESLRIRGLYGSDAALNINELKSMTKNKSNIQSTVATDIAPTTSAPETISTPTNSINDNMTDDDNEASASSATQIKDYGDSESATTVKKHQLSPSALQPNGPTAVDVAQQRKSSSMQIQSIFSQQQQHHSFQQKLQQQNQKLQLEHQQMQLEHQQMQLQQHHQQLLASQTIKHENVGAESADDSTSTYDNLEEYSKDDLNDEDSSFVCNYEDSYGGENENKAKIRRSNHKRIRRRDDLMAEAARFVSKGQTYQAASNLFNIPVSTLRFHMDRNGILPARKRGRGAATTNQSARNSSSQNNFQIKSSSRNSPPLEPPFHLIGYQLPEQKTNLI